MDQDIMAVVVTKDVYAINALSTVPRMMTIAIARFLAEVVVLSDVIQLQITVTSNQQIQIISIQLAAILVVLKINIVVAIVHAIPTKRLLQPPQLQPPRRHQNVQEMVTDAIQVMWRNASTESGFFRNLVKTDALMVIAFHSLQVLPQQPLRPPHQHLQLPQHLPNLAVKLVAGRIIHVT